MCFGKRPPEELYDLAKDPDCVVNLALSDTASDEVKQAQQRLFSLLRDQGDPRMFGNGKVFDEYEHANRANAGFYERYLKGEKIKAAWVIESDFEARPLD